MTDKSVYPESEQGITDSHARLDKDHRNKGIEEGKMPRGSNSMTHALAEKVGLQETNFNDERDAERIEMLQNAVKELVKEYTGMDKRTTLPRIERYETQESSEYARRMLIRPKQVIEQNAWIMALRDDPRFDDGLPVKYKKTPGYYLTLGVMEYLDEMYEASILAEDPDNHAVREEFLWFMPKILPQQKPWRVPLSDDEILLMAKHIKHQRKVERAFPSRKSKKKKKKK